MHHNTFATTYEGKELRPFEGRQGAMDAFDKPSLENGVEVKRKRPVAAMVGDIKDKTGHARD